jgi:hypothetical protein
MSLPVHDHLRFDSARFGRFSDQSSRTITLSQRIEDVLCLIPAATFYRFYPAAVNMSKSSPMFEVLLEDDRPMFPQHFRSGSNIKNFETL